MTVALQMLISIKMKKSVHIIFYFFTVVICASCSSIPKNKKPLWADSFAVVQVFPPEKYITGLGYAETREMAVSAADGNLASYFSREISSLTRATQNLSNADEAKDNLLREIIIKSNIELFGIKHTECYFDSDSKNYTVCAYISRAEAWSILTQKLSVVQNAFINGISTAESETEPFKKLLAVNHIFSQEEDFFNLYEMALVVYPKRCGTYTKTARCFAIEKQKAAVLKKNVTFFVTVSGDFSKQIKTKIESQLSKNGFTVSKDGAYKLNATIRADVHEYNGMYSCMPQIEIFIDSSGSTVASFAAELKNFSAYNAQTVEKVSLANLEKILEEQFVQECLY